MGVCLDLSQFPLRPTTALIDLDAIEQNVRIVARSLTPGTKLIAVVKGNGYGHGATMVAETATRAGASHLAVATVGEGRHLREEGVESPIIVLGPTHRREHELAVGLGLELGVGDVASIESIAHAATMLDRVAKVHLKIDTGMHRFGADPSDAVELARAIDRTPSLSLAGIFTHFADADAADERSATNQADIFDRVIAEIKADGIDIPLVDEANSAATLRSRRYDYGAIRLGISMYGIPASSSVPLLPGMKAAMTIESTIARLFDLKKGERVSYGGTYEALRDERAALIPIGYADGYRRALSNRGWVSAGDALLPVRGRVCMDQTVVGVPDDADLSVGSRVVVMSNGEGESPSAIELADMLDTIPYEIVTGISARVPRVYFRGSDVVAIEDLAGLSRFR